MRAAALAVLLALMVLPVSAQPRPDARKAELDTLLNALKVAPNEEAAGAIEGRVKQLWLESGSPAATLLMGRGLRDLANNAAGDAQDDFDAVLALEPELAEAYDRRAVARYLQGDYTGAIIDIQATLQREPRSFMAFQGLSRIAEARGDLKGALVAWRRALELDPKSPGGDTRLRELVRKVEGERT